MKTLLTKLYRSSPQQLIQHFTTRPQASDAPVGENPTASDVALRLRKVFEIYQTANLHGVRPDDFRRDLESRLGSIDAEIEGYTANELERQRDLSIKFEWGHNHDFGTFQLPGRMGDRHIELLANFTTYFPVRLEGFAGKRVLDVGCWTGGTTLLLAALAQEVVAIEEVQKYAAVVSYLAQSFGLDQRVTVKSLSLYDCNATEFADQFDLVYFPGVLYHLSDPLLALRILYNALKVGGTILLESAGIDAQEPLCRFEGSLVYHSGSKERMNRGGWNWFMPSPSALYRMLKEAGFDEIETRWHSQDDRVYGYAKKVERVGICKAGLSVRSIN